MERIPQSVTYRVLLKAYLSTDHVSIATGKTIAMVISKNGAAFANPSAGATNATEIASGWYYIDLSTTDTATKGPLVVRGTVSGVDDVEITFHVVSAHNADYDGIPDVAAGTTNGLPLAVDGSGRVDVLKINGTSQTARDLGTSVLLSSGTGTGQVDLSSGQVKVQSGTSAGQILNSSGQVTVATYTGNTPQTGDAYARIGAAGAALTALGDTRIAHLDADVSSRTKPADTQAAVTLVTTATNLTNAPTAGDFTAAMKTSLNAATPAVTVTDKTDFSLTSAYDAAKTASQAGDSMALTSGERTTLAGVIWSVLTSALTTSGSIGKLLVDNINATISSRSTYAGADTSGTTTLLSRIASALTITGGSVTVGTNSDKTDYTLTSAYDAAKTAAQAGDSMTLTSGERNAIAAALLDLANAVETGVTTRETLRIMLAALAGKVSGASTHAPIFRNVGDTKDRITATTDASGDRLTVTVDGT